MADPSKDGNADSQRDIRTQPDQEEAESNVDPARSGVAAPTPPPEPASSRDGQGQQRADTSDGRKDFWFDSVAQYLMAAMSVAATVISVVAVVLLRRTLNATRELSAAENRGWLQCARITFMGPPMFLGQTCDVALKISIENVGRTPVHNVMFKPIAVVANEHHESTASRIAAIKRDYQRTHATVTRTLFPHEKCEMTARISFAKNMDSIKDVRIVGIVDESVGAIHSIILYKVVGDDGVRETIRSYLVAGLDLVRATVIGRAKIKLVPFADGQQSTT